MCGIGAKSCGGPVSAARPASEPRGGSADRAGLSWAEQDCRELTARAESGLAELDWDGLDCEETDLFKEKIA